MNYKEFLQSKIEIAKDTGFEVGRLELNPALKPHQKDAVAWVLRGGRRALFESFGLGKCHGKGTKILMSDCTIKNVEDICVGDTLMGDDGTPRRVLSLARGTDKMYKITLKNGDTFTCNEAHILSCEISNKYHAYKMGDVVNLSISDYLQLPEYAKKNCFKAYKRPLDFPEQIVPFDPYVYGVWLGDGHKRNLNFTINNNDKEIVEYLNNWAKSLGLFLRICSEPGKGCKTYCYSKGAKNEREYFEKDFVKNSYVNEKRIYKEYLINSREIRIQVLAGLLDTDGYLIDNCYEIATKFQGLRDDILFLCRSLGLSVTHCIKRVNGVEYYRIYISGNTGDIPCLTRKKASKRKQIKEPLRYGFEVEYIGVGEYYGFTIDGNHLYMLEDFTVTHNTVQELEFCHQVIKKFGGKALIVCPLGVKQEFTHDAVHLLGYSAPIYVRNMEEVKAADGEILITNYERVRDGDIDPTYFVATSLDEASVLRSFGSKTYRTFLDKFKGVPYKLVATATPSPNKYMELIHYAGYLEVMDAGQALTRFFQRDSTKANNLTLYPTQEENFWLWVSSWALFITKPSDVSPDYSDDGYVLPPLEVRWHELPAHYGDTTDRDGQYQLMMDSAMGLKEAAQVKRESISARIQKMKEIVDANPDDHFVLWHDLENERQAIEDTFPTEDYHYWHKYKDGNKKALELYEKHYSCYQYKDGRERKLFVGPGEKMVLMTEKQDALFVWRKFIDDNGQKGVNCAVFRNESNILSSELILEAEQIASERWPGERLYTYVNPQKIKSTNPGFCFIKAGWEKCGLTNGGLLILEKYPTKGKNYEKIGLRSIYGSQDYEIREQRVIDFSEGKIRLFATKKELSGSGCNFQRYCHREIFLGIDYEFNDFLQAIHRVYRFLQNKPVIIDIIYMENERQIKEVLLEKWKNHDKMVEKMIEILKKYGLSAINMKQALGRKIGVETVKVEGKRYTAVNDDCIEETRRMETNSVGLIHTSIPFGNHYEYSNQFEDFGFNENNETFFQQMDYLTPELLRVLKPGRVAAIHVKDRVLYGNATGTGMPTIDPFHALCIEHYIRHGFEYFGMITVVRDVVRENNQTYRLGWTEQCKDGSKMGVGCPEYILLFRKLPTDRSTAYADDPVVKSKEEYTRAQWQIDAHGYWRSSGDCLLTKDELEELPVASLQAAYQKYSRSAVYNYHEHVELAKKLDEKGKLPAIFMVVAPGSWNQMEVWDDINYMRTLNTNQSRRRQQLHVCLAEGSLILTRVGYKPIENIEIGDMVLTHKGNWKPVIAKKCTGFKDTIQTKAQGVPQLITTPDHKLWVRKNSWVRCKDGMQRVNPDWIEAKDVPGGYVNLKLPAVEESDLTEQEWWIVGRYLADGHMGTRGDFFISVGNGKKTEFEKCANGYFGSYADGTARQYRLLSNNMSESMKDILRKCGRGAENKQVPVEGICLNVELSEALLSGYLSGDGNTTGNCTSATSVSRALLLGMAMVAQRARGVIASVYAGRAPGERMICGRNVACRQEWVISWKTSKHHHEGIILEDGAWKKAKKSERAGKRRVWSIRVADDESFTAEGCIVKNCPLPLDIVERIINRYSNKGDLVYDPFGGLMTVPMMAVKMGRLGYGCELNADYFRDGVGYLQAAEDEMEAPTLFDFMDGGTEG